MRSPPYSPDAQIAALVEKVLWMLNPLAQKNWKWREHASTKIRKCKNKPTRVARLLLSQYFWWEEEQLITAEILTSLSVEDGKIDYRGVYVRIENTNGWTCKSWQKNATAELTKAKGVTKMKSITTENMKRVHETLLAKRIELGRGCSPSCPTVIFEDTPIATRV